MANLSQEDEVLIRQFVGLHTNELHAPKVHIPSHATTSTAWELCLLARVITDRTTMDQAFSSLMLRAWKVDPYTIIRPVSRNCYLIEFVTEEEKRRVSLEGPWTFKGDLVATRHVSSHADLKPEHIAFATVWIQYYGVPLNSLTDEGLFIMGEECGTPVAPPVKGFANKRRFVRIKTMINLAEPISDRVEVTHPTLGVIKVLCLFVKVNRICRFCGDLGHEFIGCHKRERLQMILQERAQELQVNQAGVLVPKLGAWIVDPSYLPKAQQKASITVWEAQPEQKEPITKQAETLNLAVRGLE